MQVMQAKSGSVHISKTGISKALILTETDTNLPEKKFVKYFYLKRFMFLKLVFGSNSVIDPLMYQIQYQP